MAINKKLIHFLKKESFSRELANNNILDTSICFIKDTNQIWTHGLFYNGVYPVIKVTDNTATLSPNKFYIWETINSLNISLDTSNTDITSEYLFLFRSGSTPTSIALPANILWENGIAPIIKANTTYQFSIVNNLGCYASFN